MKGRWRNRILASLVGLAILVVGFIFVWQKYSEVTASPQMIKKYGSIGVLSAGDLPAESTVSIGVYDREAPAGIVVQAFNNQKPLDKNQKIAIVLKGPEFWADGPHDSCDVLPQAIRDPRGTSLPANLDNVRCLVVEDKSSGSTPVGGTFQPSRYQVVYGSVEAINSLQIIVPGRFSSDGFKGYSFSAPSWFPFGQGGQTFQLGNDEYKLFEPSGVDILYGTGQFLGFTDLGPADRLEMSTLSPERTGSLTWHLVGRDMTTAISGYVSNMEKTDQAANWMFVLGVAVSLVPIGAGLATKGFGWGLVHAPALVPYIRHKRMRRRLRSFRRRDGS